MVRRLGGCQETQYSKTADRMGGRWRELEIESTRIGAKVYGRKVHSRGLGYTCYVFCFHVRVPLLLYCHVRRLLFINEWIFYNEPANVIIYIYDSIINKQICALVYGVAVLHSNLYKIPKHKQWLMMAARKSGHLSFSAPHQHSTSAAIVTRFSCFLFFFFCFSISFSILYSIWFWACVRCGSPNHHWEPDADSINWIEDIYGVRVFKRSILFIHSITYDVLHMCAM